MSTETLKKKKILIEEDSPPPSIQSPPVEMTRLKIDSGTDSGEKSLSELEEDEDLSELELEEDEDADVDETDLLADFDKVKDKCDTNKYSTIVINLY